MAVSKKIRFEIFKRDGFKCVYCGNSPPGVILEIDHIEPKADGGKDDINNYVTSCFDCNRGKGRIKLDCIPVPVQDNLEALQEREKQIHEYRKFIKAIEKRELKDFEEVEKIMLRENEVFTDNFRNVSLRRFLRSLPLNEVVEAAQLSLSRIPQDNQIEKRIKYFCGICWRKIKGDRSKWEVSNAKN